MISTHLIELILARWIQTFELAATFTHSEVFTELSRRRDKKSYKCFNIYQMLGNLFTHVGRITVDGLAPERLGVIANAEAAHTRAGNVEHAVVHLVALKVHAVFLQCHCMAREKGREGLRNWMRKSDLNWSPSRRCFPPTRWGNKTYRNCSFSSSRAPRSEQKKKFNFWLVLKLKFFLEIVLFSQFLFTQVFQIFRIKSLIIIDRLWSFDKNLIKFVQCRFFF